MQLIVSIQLVDMQPHKRAVEHSESVIPHSKAMFLDPISVYGSSLFVQFPELGD